MKKLLTLFFTIALLASGSETVFSQKKTKAKRANAAKPKKPLQRLEETPTAQAEEVFQMKLMETLRSPENWKEHVFAAENFKVSFPRQSVKKEEPFYDESLGKVKITFYFSLSDSGMYAVGSLPLPYAVTDKALLRSFYQEIAKEFLSDGEWIVKETIDITVNDKPALEIIADDAKDKNLKAKIRTVLIGNRVFVNMALPLDSDELTESEKSAIQAKASLETKNFFDSFADLPKTSPLNASPVPALFKATFTDNIFKSEYFNFSIKIPEGWAQISQEDVSGLRARGQDVLQASTDGKLKEASSERRNLFTFTAKPLGTERNSLFSCNVTKKPSPSAEVSDLSKITEQTIRQVKIYEVTKPTHEITLGRLRFVGFTLKGKLAGETFDQALYFYSRGDYALGFSIVYHNEEQRKLLFDALGSMQFEAK